MTKFILRLDDIFPYMDFRKFKRLRDLFLRFKIPAVLGLIPDCRARHLFFRKTPFKQFVKEIRFLEKRGWEIAMHGYTHELLRRNKGILKINQASEFAGLSYNDQFRRVQKGKMILEKMGFQIETFIAPWHSFDKNTFKALVSSGFKIVSDGLGIYPWKEQNLLFIPQILWQAPDKIEQGIYTLCLHSSYLTYQDIEELSSFLYKIKEKTTTCREVKDWFFHQTYKKRKFFLQENKRFRAENIKNLKKLFSTFKAIH